MSIGPLRRLAGTIGLLALVPTAVMLVLERVTLTDAAVRAGVTLLVVILAARLAGWWLSAVAGGLEQRSGTGEEDQEDHGRRVTDGPVPAER